MDKRFVIQQAMSGIPGIYDRHTGRLIDRITPEHAQEISSACVEIVLKAEEEQMLEESACIR